MHRIPWRVSELHVLTEGIRGALSPREICVPGRSESALRSMARKLKLVGDGVPRTPWTEHEKQLLTKLVTSGMKATAITRDGLLPGFNRNAIQKQMQRMGLGHPRRSRPQKNALRFKGRTLERFHAFLNANARCCTPMQIVQIWNEEHEPKVSHARVLYHLETLGLRLARRVVIKMAYSREKQRLCTQQFIEREKRRRELQWLEEPVGLRKLADDLEHEAVRDGRVIQLQHCATCEEPWPARAEFFHVTTKVTAGGRRFYIAKACRLCRNRQRREKPMMQTVQGLVSPALSTATERRGVVTSETDLPGMTGRLARHDSDDSGSEIIAAQNWSARCLSYSGSGK
jgi:hypothetical protein